PGLPPVCLGDASDESEPEPQPAAATPMKRLKRSLELILRKAGTSVQDAYLQRSFAGRRDLDPLDPTGVTPCVLQQVRQRTGDERWIHPHLGAVGGVGDGYFVETGSLAGALHQIGERQGTRI